MYEIFVRLLQEYKVKAIDVTKSTGVPASTFSDWKKGKSSPKAEKLAKIANYFNVSAEYLQGKTPYKNKQDELMSKISAIPYNASTTTVPIIGCVKAGFGAIAYEDYLGQEPADVSNPEEYFLYARYW